MGGGLGGGAAAWWSGKQKNSRSMSLYGIPFLLTNLGAQTIYVIDQRLRDQNIPPPKAQRILGDICAVLFSENLWDQIISPQDLYTSNSTRSVLEKIVHSSLIKLNAASMNKLYDLTQMVFKHQLLVCDKPSVLWTLTKKHIETVKELVPDLYKLNDFNTSMGKFAALAESLSVSDWVGLRQALLEFLRERRVKITLLMNSGFQAPDGSLGCLNQQKDVDAVGGVNTTRFQALREGQQRVSTGKVALVAYAKRRRLILAPKEIVCNIYDQDPAPSTPKTPTPVTSPRITPSPTPSPGTSPSKHFAGYMSPRPEAGDRPRPEPVASSASLPATMVDGGKELNSLASMIGAPKGSPSTTAPRRLSIFADSIDVAEESDREGDVTGDPLATVKLVQDIVLETKLMSPRRNLEKVVADLDLGGTGTSAPGMEGVAEEDDDLLDLMDGA